MFLFAPAQAFAASAACNAINSFSGTYVVDSGGNGTNNFTDPGSQPLANGETVTYSWTGNTKGAYVYVVYTQNGGNNFASDSLLQSTASSGSGSFTFSSTAPGDYLEMGLANFPPYDGVQTPKPSANDSTVQITISCTAATTLSVAMTHSGNAVQGGSLGYTITPSISGGATTTAPLTATFTLPSGMTYSSASGSGWSCSGSGQSGSCSRTSSFGPGSGPAITLTANFASNASSPLSPSVQLSGGGASNSASASSSTVVVATPTVTAIAPTSGTTAGGTNVVITGTGLSGATAVTFGGTAATGFTINSATQITATSPAGSGTVDVRVTTAGGTSATSAADQFTYVAPPTASAYTAPAVAYGATGVTFSVAAQATNSPTSFAVGSATTANGGAVSINNAGLVTYSAPAGFRGNDSFTYTASNGGGTSSPATVTVPVGDPTLAASLTGSGTRGAALSGVQLVTTGGTAPYSCATTLASGALPAGTQLNSNCTITGTPSASGTFNFTANVTDSSVPSGFTQTTGTLALAIAAPSLSLSPSAGALPSGTAGTSYSRSFTASGGTAPYSYAITAGALPTGLALSGGTISGTPTQTGTYNFTVTATDSASAGSGGPYSVASSYSITVGAPTIALTPTTLTGATVGAAYSQAVTASGGVAPYAYSITAGTLPAGLTLASDGTLSGTPSAAGSFSFTLTATDSTTGSGAPFTGNRAYSLTVAAPTITITPTSLSSWPAGTPYSQTLTASGGTGGYTFAVTAGALPPGWSLSTSGVLSGTATASNVYNFTITATDQSTGAGAPYSGSRAYTATITIPSFTLTAPTLSGAVDQAYTGNFVVGGGTAPYTFSVYAGSLPPGLTLATNGTLSGTPTTAGTFNFTVVARDSTSGGGSPYGVADNYNFTVSPPLAPTAGAVSANVAYNAPATSITLSLSGGAAVSVAVATPPAHGTATVNGLTIDYTPASGYYGADSFTYTATNAGGTSAPATVSITVSTPGAPTTADRSGVTVPYDGGGTSIDLSTSISGTYSSIAVATAPAHGTTSVAGNIVTYTPAAGYFGADSFTYTATGPGGTSAPATVTLTVATPGAPIAADRSGVAVPNGSTGTTIDLSSSITGVHNSIAVATAPAHGTTSVAGDVVTYTPAAGYFGADSFTYTATGPGGTSIPATVTLTVATPAAPVAADRSGVAVPHGSTGTAIDLSSSITGVHNSIAVATAPAHGSTSVSGDVITFTPVAGYYGADSFTYTATGPGGTSAPATVTLTVAAPAAPVAADRSGVAVPHGSTGTAIDLSSSITGVHNSIAVASAPAHGTTSVAGDVVTYTPAAGYFGADSFTYTATGPGGTSAPATVTLAIAAPAAPTAANVSGVAVPYATAAPIDLSTAITGAHTSIAIATAPTHGTASVAGNVVTYTPAAGYFGADSFTYTATGPGGTSAPATVSLVVATPAPPTVANVSDVAVPYDTATAIDLAASVTGAHTSIAVATAPAHGTTSVAGDVITYTPAPGYYGADSFTYTATGPGGTSAPGTVTVTVAAPAPPVAADRSGVTVDYNSAGTPIDLTASVTGVYTSIAVVGAPARGTASVSGSVITYVPANGSFGADSFTYTATGPGGTSAPATVTLTVATPPPPAAEPSNSTVPAATTAQPGSNTEIDLSALVNGSFNSIEIATPPAHGTLTLRTTGAAASGGIRPLAVLTVTAVYTPNVNYVGTDSFSFVAVGPGGRSAPAAVTIQVVGSVPQALPKTAETGDGQSVSVDLTAGALNGPFTGAAVVSMTPAGAATTQVVASGSGASQAYRLDIVPAARFGGKIVIEYTLSNALGTSAPATITVTVAARPDPTLDPNVRGLSDAQAEAARRFGRAQVANFMRRTEQLHNGGGSSRPQMGVSLASRDQRQDPRVNPAFDAYALSITDRMRVSGEDPALGAIARGAAANRNGAGGLNAAPAARPMPAIAGSRASAAAATAPAGPGNADGDDGADGDGTRRKGSVALWSGGAVDIGTQDATTDRSKITATTSGLSAGADIKLAEGVLVGIGGGYGNDVSHIGGSAARVRSESRLVAAYASLMPVDGAFVDGMVGLGDLSFATRRQVASSNLIALGNRDGNFTVGALAFGIDRAGGPLRWSLYARGEFLKADLDGYVESGAGRMDLRFDQRDVKSLTGTLGARLELEQRYDALTMIPRLRFEWNHELQGSGAQRLDYADIAGASLYSLSTFGWKRDQFQLTLGTRLLLPRSWSIDVEGGYRGGGQETAGTLRVLLGKEF